MGSFFSFICQIWFVLSTCHQRCFLHHLIGNFSFFSLDILIKLTSPILFCRVIVQLQLHILDFTNSRIFLKNKNKNWHKPNQQQLWAFIKEKKKSENILFIIRELCLGFAKPASLSLSLSFFFLLFLLSAQQLLGTKMFTTWYRNKEYAHYIPIFAIAI